MALFDVIQPRICELGKIKIGGKDAEVRKTKDGGEWRAPKKLDHFIITTLNRNKAGDLVEDSSIMESLKKDYGDADGKLRQIPIAVLSNDIEDIMQSAFVWYIGKKVAARSDGLKLTKYYDKKTNVWLDEPEEADWMAAYADLKDSKGNPLFKRHTTLNVVITAKQAHWGGVYRFRTTSVITASQLAGSLVEIKQQMGGILRGLPLRLAVRPMQVSPGGKTTTVYVVHAYLVGDDLFDLQSKALERAKAELSMRSEIEQTQREYRKLLLPPGHESGIEAADIAGEFHPEEIETETTPDVPSVDPLMQELTESTNGEKDAKENERSKAGNLDMGVAGSAETQTPKIVRETLEALAESKNPGDLSAFMDEFRANCVSLGVKTANYWDRVQCEWFIRSLQLAPATKDWKRLCEQAAKFAWPDELAERLETAEQEAKERLQIIG